MPVTLPDRHTRPDLLAVQAERKARREAEKRLERLEARIANQAMHQVRRYSPADIKDLFVTGNHDRALAVLAKAISEEKPWAVKAWLEAAGAIGGPAQIWIQVRQQLGVKDDQELANLIEAGRTLNRLTDSSQVSLEQYRDEALDLLVMVLRERPDWRQQCLDRLASNAQVIADTSDSSSMQDAMASAECNAEAEPMPGVEPGMPGGQRE